MGRFRLTAPQRQQLLAQLRSTPDAGLYRRTLALLEVDQGRPISEVARLLRVGRRTVHYWIQAYTNSPHPDVLVDRRGGMGT